MTNTQQVAAEMGYRLPATEQERRAVNATMFDRFAKAAAKSNRSDAAELSAHYAARADSQRQG